MANADNLPRWYFGGLSSMMATCFTHPLDLIKVQLQTQVGKKVSIAAITAKIVKENGILGLYNGLTASQFRQMMYATTRFAIYDTAKIFMGKDSTFAGRVLVATVGGMVGGWVGTPGDKVNVRMQNDSKLPPEKRLNYKHVFDGLWRIYKTEGFTYLFSGAVTASVRAGVMAVGQLASYDQIKILLLSLPFFGDNMGTHFVASTGAGVVATTMTQPLDVVKTRIMNAKPGEFKGIMDVVFHTAKEGPLAFFKGYIPAFLRLAPHTILLFIFYEQLRLHFGYLPPERQKKE